MDLYNKKFKVIVNKEEIFTILPIDSESPIGWSDAGKEGTKDECLSFINEEWQNTIPSNIRALMAELGKLD